MQKKKERNGNGFLFAVYDQLGILPYIYIDRERESGEKEE